MRAPHLVFGVGLVLAASILLALWWTSAPDEESDTYREAMGAGGPPTATDRAAVTPGVSPDRRGSSRDAGVPLRPGIDVPLPPEQWPERIRPSEPRSVTTPAPDETPTVSKEEVREAINAAKPLIAQCFADAALKNPGDQKVKLKFTIEGYGVSGRFKDGEVVDSTIVDPWVQACFLEALADAQFPAPSGGGAVTVIYPFSYVVPDAGP